MAARSQYSGLCETCDREPDCTLRRSSRLEIILCEEFSTQPKMNPEAPASAGMEGDGTAAGRVKRAS